MKLHFTSSDFVAVLVSSRIFVWAANKHWISLTLILDMSIQGIFETKSSSDIIACILG